MGDAKAMFHQVKVHPDDRDVLRFLWWEDGNPSLTIQVFRMTVHLFGGIWSPSCANFALRLTARNSGHSFSRSVVETVTDSFYVDDCLKSVTTETEAVHLVQELSSLLAKGGFHLTKWVSNSKSALKAIPPEDRAEEIKALDLEHDDLSIERALGIQWNTETDTFGYKIVVKDRPMTRRGLLSIMSSIYDPLGFASPFILLAKRIFQNGTGKKRTWDAPLDDLNLTSWKTWLADLPKFERFWIDRCILPQAFGRIAKVELHHFSDASSQGYGVASYRTEQNKTDALQSCDG